MRPSKYEKTRTVLSVGAVLVAAGLVAGCSIIIDEHREGGACGDGVKDPGEECDQNDFGGRDCGWYDGTGPLHCNGFCMIESHGCIGGGNCGDGILDGGEDCDGMQFGEHTCESEGFGPGDLGCTGDCTLEMSGCGPSGTCGDGFIDPWEFCDSMNLGGQSCSSLGFGIGNLVCLDCQFDVSQCGDPAGAPNGAPCVVASDCSGSDCLHNTYNGGTPYSYCSHVCDNGVCPGGGVCIVGPGGSNPMCYRWCEDPEVDCQPDFMCLVVSPGQETICWPPPPYP